MDRKEDVLLRFGRQVAALREQNNIGIEELASRSGLDEEQIEGIEGGKINIRYTSLLALARGLGVTPRQLLEFL